jgi:hypothetical protein
MSTERKFNYWELDNEELVIKDEMLPSWVAAFTGIEALVMAYYKHEQELVKKADNNEQTKQKPMADSHDEGSTGSESTEGSNE